MSKIANADDFATWTRRAKTMTMVELGIAIADCMECVRLNINSEWYTDEACTYRTELNKRMVKKAS